MSEQAVKNQDVRIPAGEVWLNGELAMPASAAGVVVFAHGSGSSRHSPRNKYVAGVICNANLATLLLDLLTPDEEAADAYSGHLRFDIELLAGRLVETAKWLKTQEETRNLMIGFFGASTGAGAALVAAAALGDNVGAVVSRGGRPDLAGDALPGVKAPVLLIVGGRDHVVIGLNETAYVRLRCKKGFKIVPGATHLFEERGALETVAGLAVAWFENYLHGPTTTVGNTII